MLIVFNGTANKLSCVFYNFAAKVNVLLVGNKTFSLILLCKRSKELCITSCKTNSIEAVCRLSNLFVACLIFKDVDVEILFIEN